MDRSDVEEEALMTAYVAGDADAFRRLFGRLAPRLHAFLRRSVGSGAEADDLLQQTFLRLHDARDRWRSGQPVRPWLFTIAARARLDWLRRRSRSPEVPEAADAVANAPAAGDGADDALVRGEVAARVRAELDRLPEAQRTIVHLHRYEGMTFGQIAAVLGTTEGAVKLRAFRAYETLRRRLADLVEEERT
jgi:RNA polymerase sigma-70 factor (ECF subfamily)